MLTLVSAAANSASDALVCALSKSACSGSTMVSLTHSTRSYNITVPGAALCSSSARSAADTPPNARGSQTVQTAAPALHIWLLWNVREANHMCA